MLADAGQLALTSGVDLSWLEAVDESAYGNLGLLDKQV